jgi:quercetin 2,3-dioxygenase
MIEIRPFTSLGKADLGWLKANFHFSFSQYQDPDRMNWGNIRVWNDDAIAPHTGFAPHPHRDMEIITYVRTGAISHEDSLGNKGRTVAGDVQVMSAGSGITHSEFNHEDETTTLFQIWVIPRETGGAPAWGTRPFPKADRAGRWMTLASGYADDAEALPIRADARVLASTLPRDKAIDLTIEAGRCAYLVPATGQITVNDTTANARDGVALGAGTYRIMAIEEAELVVVEGEREGEN